MSAAATEIPTLSARPIAAGEGWRVTEVVCTAGPRDVPFEEAHATVSIAAVMAGSFSYRTDAGEAVMAPGALLLGNPGACFCCRHEHATGDRCIAVQLAPAALEEVAREIGGIRTLRFAGPRVAPDERLAPLLADLAGLADDPQPEAAEEIALRLAGSALAADGGGRLRAPAARDAARATAALQAIEQSLAEPISLAGLAAAAGVSRFHFLRLFRQAVGTTPYRYVLGRRLARAAMLLQRTDESVLDIALESGFADLSEFTRRFRARFGMPPGAYRKARRGRP